MRVKTLIIVMATALLFPAAAFPMGSFDFPVVSPVISFVAGEVTVKGAGATGWTPAEVGRLLASGDTVRTGPASKAEISCATGKMRLYENTVIIVPEVVDEGDKEDIREVTLDDGAGLFRIKKRGVENGFEVRTSNIIAGVKGTLFAVLHFKLEGRSRVAVYSGQVEVTDVSRSPETLTPLTRGKVMDVLEEFGFGEMEDFDPVDAWKQWEKEINPAADRLGLMSPSAVRDALYEALFEDTDQEEEYQFECPPVIDNDGNVIVP